MNKTSGQTIVIILIFFVALMFLVVSQQNDMEPEQTPRDSNEIFNEVSNTTTTVVLDNEELAENFINYYKQNKIKGYVNLTIKEAERTLSISQRVPASFKFDEYECFRDDIGTTHSALLDEYFVLNEFNDYYAESLYSVTDNKNNEYAYFLMVSFNCKLTDDDSEYPEWVYLYGAPFYKDNTWWIYIEKEWEPVPMDVPGWLTYLATRVELVNFEETYKEWVIDALPPEIEFLDCPTERIDKDSYEIKFNIKPGNADLAYFGTFIQKNGENYSRAFFEKEWNDDVFSFPKAGTSNLYGQLIEKYDDEDSPEFNVEVVVGNDYDLYANNVCVVKFSK